MQALLFASAAMMGGTVIAEDVEADTGLRRRRLDYGRAFPRPVGS
jgi:hypothetical protein